MQKKLRPFVYSTSFLALAQLGACSSLQQNQSPQELGIRSDYAEQQISQLCKTSLQDLQTKIDQIKKIPVGQRTFQNTLLTFERVTADFSDQVTPLIFMENVHSNKAIRKEASACEADTGTALAALYTDHDLYLILKDGKPTDSSNNLSTIDQRLAYWTLIGFEKNGMNLPPEQLKKVSQLFQELATLQSKFSENINNDESTITASPEELNGIAADYIATLKQDQTSHLYTISVRRDAYEKILPNAESAALRKRFLTSYYNIQGQANTAVMEKALAVRRELAKDLGYKSWADYQLENGRMAKNVKTTMAFLNSLRSKLVIKNKEVLEKIRVAKQKYFPHVKSVRVEAWDPVYYLNQIKKTQFKVDEEAIAEYFPADTVIQGMFDIYSTLFHVRFERVADAKVWAENVSLYKIIDQDTHNVRAYFYADLFSRTGKYNHFAAFPIISARILPDGKWSLPIASIVGNFPAPTATKPSLLQHDMVETLFHEFGHIMHQTLSTVPYASLSGSNTLQDFVEAPSQMLENWVWNPTILQKISGHYRNPSQKIPEALAQQKIALRSFDAGYFYSRQLVFGFYDMEIHRATHAIDINRTFAKVYRDIQRIDPIPHTHFPASFGHLMGGYDAGYYGYLWSKVYAEDMFTRFDQEGLTNPTVGLQYRDRVISQGNARDPMELLTDFLGRKPNLDAFYKSVGL